MTIHHMRLNHGTVSLTERLLRREYPQLAVLFARVLLNGGETIDLSLTAQQLAHLRAVLVRQSENADAGQQALVHTLLERWPDLTSVE